MVEPQFLQLGVNRLRQRRFWPAVRVEAIARRSSAGEQWPGKGNASEFQCLGGTGHWPVSVGDPPAD